MDTKAEAHRRGFGEDLQAQVPPPCRCERCCIVGHPSFDFETFQSTRLNIISLISYRISVLIPFVPSALTASRRCARGLACIYLWPYARSLGCGPVSSLLDCYALPTHAAGACESCFCASRMSLCAICPPNSRDSPLTHLLFFYCSGNAISNIRLERASIKMR